MALKVTRAVTKYGHYYKAGTIIQDPSSTELSLGRVWGWETVAAPSPAKTAAKPARKRTKSKSKPIVKSDKE